MKALVMIRASTESQKIEDQHNEMVRFCSDEGYDKLVFVEDKGASAIKLNDQYRVMIDQVKEEIYRGRMDRDRRKEYESQLKVLREKVQATRKKLESMDDKKARINELYVEGMIGKEEFKIRQNKTLLEVKRYKDTLLSYKEQEGALLSLLEGKREETLTDEKLRTLISGVYKIADLKIMNETVKKHIKRVTSSPEWFGKERDRRAVRQNAQLITVETVYSGIQRYIYVARKYKGHRFWYYEEDGSEHPVTSVRPIVREPLGPLHPRVFKKVKDL